MNLLAIKTPTMIAQTHSGGLSNAIFVHSPCNNDIIHQISTIAKRPQKAAKVLRSWVQLPPGPFLSVVQIRHYFELDFNNCRTNSAAMPMSYTSDADNEYRTPRNLENNILSLNLFIHWEKRKIDR